MSHASPTSCSFKGVRVNVQPQINVMTGVTDEANTWTGRETDEGKQEADEPEGDEEEKGRTKMRSRAPALGKIQENVRDALLLCVYNVS